MITDVNGHYSVNVFPGNCTLKVRWTGYALQTQIVSASGTGTITVNFALAHPAAANSLVASLNPAASSNGAWSWGYMRRAPFAFYTTNGTTTGTTSGLPVSYVWDGSDDNNGELCVSQAADLESLWGGSGMYFDPGLPTAYGAFDGAWGNRALDSDV